MSNLESFKQNSVWLMDLLIKTFELTKIQAAAVCGNGYQESMLQPILEDPKDPSIGGIAWFQWTGVRRHAFLVWCAGAKMNWRTKEANWGFLAHELSTDYNYALLDLKATKTITDAVEVFEEKYEAAGEPYMTHRILGAQIALQAYEAAGAHTS